MYVIFDLDGTLADGKHRQHFAEQAKWNEYFDLCSEDLPIWPVIDVNNALDVAGHIIDIWTGRSDSVREQTAEWLDRYDVRYRNLKMRPAQDHRPDHTIKEEWLDAIRSGKPNIVFEDRNRVVDMWRRHGVRCFQVAPGDF